MFLPIILMGGLGIVIGAVLAAAAKTFYVYEDPKVEAIDHILPGANCGGCGFPGCNANAVAIVNNESDVNSCVAAGKETAEAIALVMGVAISDKEPEFAGLNCDYGNDEADMKYLYKGIGDCRAVTFLFGGMKECRVGCLGLGTCVKACMFNALVIDANGLPKVDQNKCTGCGACEKVCPKNIIRLSSVTRRIMREYTKDECTTPCQRACPTGIDIKKYIRLIKEKDYEGSLQVIKERNPFPTVISRICPAICELNCRRLLQDEPVGINDLKRFVCDYEMNNKRVQPYKAPLTNKKIAIIGGGIQGLSTAFFCARLGHKPTVFEATNTVGGILRMAVSQNRLPQKILDWDIKGIEEIGVSIVKNVKVGHETSIGKLLQEGYDAVFMATGGWDSRLALKDNVSQDKISKIESVFPGAFLLIDLIKNKFNETINFKNHAVIAGGGVTAIEAVQVLKENKVKQISIVVREKDDLIFDHVLKEKLEKMGVKLIYNSGITKVIGQKEQLDSIECTNLDTGEKLKIKTDTLVIGSGRFPELVFTSSLSNKEIDENSLLNESNSAKDNDANFIWEGHELQKKVSINGKNKELGLLSNQDVISEYPSVVSAINGGRKAATIIHHLIYKTNLQDSLDFLNEQSCVQNVFSLNNVSLSMRNKLIDVQEKLDQELMDGFSTGFSIKTAQKEANRCLRCGLICYEKSSEKKSLQALQEIP